MRTRMIRVYALHDAQKTLMERTLLIPTPGRVLDGGILDQVVGRPGQPERPEGDQDDENYNPDGTRKDRHERKPHFAVELLCRTFAGDIGTRPLPNMVFWESPDIWIEGPSGDPDVATPGQNNQVKVHVWNLGLADAWGTHVDLFWCDPSVGINAAMAHPIGSTTLSLAAGQHAVVSFDWVPVLVNNGHECLVAHVYDPVSDPIVAPFNPLQDRHVGQRNISVVDLPAGETLEFDFFTQNLSLGNAATELEVHVLEGEAVTTLAATLGRATWRSAGGEAAQLSIPIAVNREATPGMELKGMSVFRETLQRTPKASERREILDRLRSLLSASQDLSGSDGPEDHGRNNARNSTPIELTDRNESETVRQSVDPLQGLGRGFDPGAWDPTLWQRKSKTIGALQIPPGSSFKLSIQAELPKNAASGTADIYRVIERTAGQITGGMTIILRAT